MKNLLYLLFVLPLLFSCDDASGDATGNSAPSCDEYEKRADENTIHITGFPASAGAWADDRYALKMKNKTGFISHCGDNGTLVHLGYFKNGKRDGLQKNWYENGQLHYKYNVKDGKPVNPKCYDKNGIPKDCKDYDLTSY